MAGGATAAQTVEIMEIRARHDRNRLLGTYDPARGVLRLFHRGGIVTVELPPFACEANQAGQPIDVRLIVE